MVNQRSVYVFEGDEFALALQAGMEPIEKHRPAGKSAGRVRIAGKGKPVKLGAIGKRIQKAIAKTMTPTKKANPSDMVVAVFNNENPLVRKTVRDIMERVPAIVEARQQQLTDENIDALVSVYMPSPPDTDATQLLLDSNARARARFLEAWPCLTSKQVSEAAGHGSKNQSMTTSRWKGGGKIFSAGTMARSGSRRSSSRTGNRMRQLRGCFNFWAIGSRAGRRPFGSPHRTAG